MSENRNLTATTSRRIVVWVCHHGRQIVWVPDEGQHRHVGRGLVGSVCDLGLAEMFSIESMPTFAGEHDGSYETPT